jgi:cell wall-associated NlpC family hydrolase
VATPFQTFKTKLGIGGPTQKGTGYGYTPTILQQGQSSQQVGQKFLDALGQRKDNGQTLYDQMNQGRTNRLANDLVNKSAGLKLDEFGRPDIKLADFGTAGQSSLKDISQRGDLATQTEEAKKAFQDAITTQNLGSYGFGSYSGSDIPGASSGNLGAQAAAKAMKVASAHTSYVWGGNSLVNGVDCSGLVQQIYSQLGVKVPRTTYEQAKSGKRVSVNQIRPGDLVFYNNYGHVGIYVGHGKIVHAANSKLGVITSNLNNSNGQPILVLRPY